MTNNDTPDKALVALHSCPPGLFRFGETIGFKTEYGMTICDDNGAEMPGHLVRFKVSNYPDAYVLESGEVFWGGAKSHAERSGLLVEPLTLTTLSQPQHGGLVEAAKTLVGAWEALPEALIAVPDGMCIVPREPTEAMAREGDGAYYAAERASLGANEYAAPSIVIAYRAMIAAATGEAS